MNNLSEIEKAQLATLIDGEGCITAFRQQWSKLTKRKNPAFSPVVQIVNADPLIIEWAHRTVGCGTAYSRATTHKRKYGIRLSSGQAVELLREILPYLIIKQQRAKLLIDMVDEFNRERDKIGGHFSRHNQTPDDLVQKWAKTYETLKQMNQTCEGRATYDKSPYTKHDWTGRSNAA